MSDSGFWSTVDNPPEGITISSMRRGIRCASILVLLAGCAIVLGYTPTTSSLAPQSRSSDRPYSQTFLLQSAGSLGYGAGSASIALPATLLYYLFSGGDLASVVVAEGALLGLGSAAGACWTGRSLGNPAKFWPALGLAFLPEIGAGLVMVLTHKGADLTDPLVLGCCGAAILGSPILATVGANLGRDVASSGTGSRLSIVPELSACSNRRPGITAGTTHVSAGVGLRLSF
jgi:hypothetical protein